MPDRNKAILKKANAAVTAGNNEGFLLFCSEETRWTFVGERTLNGKEAVREWMINTYKEPPELTIDNLIAEGDYVTAIGTVTVIEDGNPVMYSYCDVWKFRAGMMVELRAFVIKLE